jgi:hypothetical protein
MVPLAPPVEAGRGLLMLLQAYDYAADCGTDSWQFAVEFSDVLATGMTRLDLRWLLVRRYAQHACETTVHGDTVRSFRPLLLTDLPANASIVLTDLGSRSLRSAVRCATLQQGSESHPMLSDAEWHSPGGDVATLANEGALAIGSETFSRSPPKVTPTWNPNLRELRFHGKLVKKYCVPAANQEMILTVFEEEGWPDWIDDPLPPVSEVPSKPRLRAAIKSLNGKQKTPLLRFHVNHGGQVVSWEESLPKGGK